MSGFANADVPDQTGKTFIVDLPSADAPILPFSIETEQSARARGEASSGVTGRGQLCELTLLQSLRISGGRASSARAKASDGTTENNAKPTASMALSGEKLCL